MENEEMEMIGRHSLAHVMASNNEALSKNKTHNRTSD